jgi:hypothetical protein
VRNGNLSFNRVDYIYREEEKQRSGSSVVRSAGKMYYVYFFRNRPQSDKSRSCV